MSEGPVRTCLGCRRRDDQAALLRVVAPAGTGPETEHAARAVVPDPGRRAPGRGAYVHPERTCIAAAVKRRAFGRALRVSVDAAAAGAVLTAYVERPRS